MYKQCKLTQNNSETRGWIEDRGAKLGVKVELVGHDGLWLVEEVGTVELTRSEVSEKQRMDRRSLLSIKPL